MVPKRLLHRGRGEKGDREGEVEGSELNQTDQEKTIAKDAANLLQVCVCVCGWVGGCGCVSLTMYKLCVFMCRS